jgi:hypothetical protein
MFIRNSTNVLRPSLAAAAFLIYQSNHVAGSKGGRRAQWRGPPHRATVMAAEVYGPRDLGLPEGTRWIPTNGITRSARAATGVPKMDDGRRSEGEPRPVAGIAVVRSLHRTDSTIRFHSPASPAESRSVRPPAWLRGQQHPAASAALRHFTPRLTRTRYSSVFSR